MSAGRAFLRAHASGIGLALAGVVVLAAFAAGGRIVVPVAVQFVLDDAVLGGSPQERGATLLRVVLVGAAGILAAGAASWAIHRIVVARAERLLAELRTRVFDHALRLAPAVQDRTTPGAIVSRITTDVDAVSQYVSGGGIQLVQNLLQMTLAAVVMSIYSWPLALAVILGTIPFLVAMQSVRRLVRRRYVAVRAAVGQVHESVSELVRGIEVIHAFGIVPVVRARVDEAVDAVRRALQRTQYPLHANTALGEAAGGTITALVVIGAAVIGTRGGLFGAASTAGEVIAFLFLTTFFVRPLQFTVTNLGEAQSAIAGLRRTQELLDEPVDVTDEDAGERLPDGALALRVRGLGFTYPDGSRALRDVDLDIPFGQFVAIVGHTGSGKTTLGKLLTRRLRATEGVIELGGVDLQTIAAASLARRVAVVPQTSFLFDGTVRDNLRLAAPDADDAAILGVLDALGLGGWRATLEDGLDTAVGQGGAGLSTGERQLVALVRAAVVDPAVLVLDEATSNLDPELDAGVQSAMHRAALGRTTIAIAHRLTTAEHADRVLVVHDGRIVEDGPPAALAARGGAYARLLAAWHRRDAAAETPDIRRPQEIR